MSLPSCSLLVPLSKKLNPKMLSWHSNIMAVLLPPVRQTAVASYTYIYCHQRYALHDKTTYFFSFGMFCCTPPIFSICHSIAHFTHAQLLTENNSGVQSHSPFTTMLILLCQHDFHIKTMFQEHESRTSV